MKECHYISFTIPRNKAEQTRKALANIGCEQWWRPPPCEGGLPSFENIFEATDPRLSQVLELSKLEGFCLFRRIEHQYADAELRSFPLLYMAVTVDMEHGGLGYGTMYDLSKGCPQCGTGAVQTSPLLLPLKGLPKKGLLCATDAGDVLVAERLADALRSEGVYGWELRQVLLHGNKEPLPWWQMLSAYEMPKVSTASKGIGCDPPPRLCPKCKRNGRGNPLMEPMEIVYDRRQVDGDALPDVVCMWERFGASRIDRNNFEKSFIPSAPLLVKPKVFDIFRRLKVKAAEGCPR